MVKFKLTSIKYVRILKSYRNLNFGMVRYSCPHNYYSHKNYGDEFKSKNRRNYCPYP